MKVPKVPLQLVQPACAQPAVSQQGTGALFLLDKSLEKERRSGALWVTGNQYGPTNALSRQHSPAFALTQRLAGPYQSQSNAGCCSALMTGVSVPVKQSGDPFLLCDLP